MKKILFIVPSMRGGGSEKVISTIVNNLDKSRYSISLVLLKKEGNHLTSIDNTIRIIDLKTSQARYSVFKLYKLIKLEKPDIVFSTLGYLNLIIALLIPFLSKKIKFIARESSIVSIRNKKDKFPKLFDFLYCHIYKNFDEIICQSIYMQSDLIYNYKIDKNKLTVINNPVDIENIQKQAENNNMKLKIGKINLLAVGRLDKVKGYDLLLNVINKLDERFHLTILGVGPQENNLKKLSNKLKITNKVSFLGFQLNPYEYMKKADLMILSSRYEGFPNVLLEANACGTPVVGFSCPGGVAEIIEDGINGYLVKCEDIDSMVKVISGIVLNDFDKSVIINRCKNKYSLSFILSQYENIFRK